MHMDNTSITCKYSSDKLQRVPRNYMQIYGKYSGHATPLLVNVNQFYLFPITSPKFQWGLYNSHIFKQAIHKVLSLDVGGISQNHISA